MKITTNSEGPQYNVENIRDFKSKVKNIISYYRGCTTTSIS
jgi:hypothetical protein